MKLSAKLAAATVEAFLVAEGKIEVRVISGPSLC